MFGGFFAGKRILVTGAAGVKGTWLALALLDAGAEVVGIDSAIPAPDSNFAASGLAGRIAFLRRDVNDLTFLRDAMAGVDGVFHLAAVAIVTEASRAPYETYVSNTMGVASVLEALRTSDRARYAVMVTTDKVYRSKAGEPWVEEDPLGATGPYAVSKACAEYVIADYQNTYFSVGGKRVGVGRAGNVLVGGDLYSSSRIPGGGRIFVDCFEALSQGKPPEIFNPAFTRPYIYGLDVIAGYMSLMAHLDSDDVAGQAFNFGPWEQVGVPNGLLATKACELWGKDIFWHSGARRAEPFEKQSLRWDKGRRLLGWQPAFTFHEALSATARWYWEYYRRRDAGTVDMADFNGMLLAEHRRAARNMGIAWTASSASVTL